MFQSLRTARKSSQSVKPGTQASQTTLGTGTKLVGELTSDSDVHINGEFEGNITAKGRVSVGQHGSVEGDITGGQIAVSGTVRGDLEAQHIGILKTGRVWGDMVTDTLSTEEGGFLQGTVMMRRTEAAPRKDRSLGEDLEAQVAEIVAKRMEENGDN